MSKKIVIIGCGGVGAAIGYSIMLTDEAEEIVFIDPAVDRMRGEILDMDQGLGYMRNTSVRAGDYADCADCDIIIITAGRNRKPGETRRDLLEGNKQIMTGILEQIRPYYKDSFVIIISNPVDALTQVAYEQGFIPADKLCGTGCILDTSRWICELAKYLQADKNKVTGWAVGEHGSGQYMLWDSVKVDGSPVEDYCAANHIAWNEEVKERLQKTVTDMGADIIARKGRTQYGIAGTTTYLVKCLMGQEKTPVSISCKPESSLAAMTSAVVRVADCKIWFDC